MNNGDIPAFFKLLDDTYDMIGKSAAAKVISPTAKALFFSDLKRYPLEYIEQALSAHRLDPVSGRFTPTVADIASQIERRRPVQWLSPDEAWAKVPKLEDEPGIMCNETAEALAVAAPLLAEGDEVAARMAFKGCYTRLVERAKLDRRGPEFFVSPGGSYSDQLAVIEEGQRLGLLPAPTTEAMLSLPGPSQPGKARLDALLATLKPKAIGDDHE